MHTQVVNLSALSPVQLQKVYVKFTKELYILSKLQHPRVVTVYGCATTIEELTLVMEVSARYFKLNYTLCVSNITQ
jgi:Protein tyrosine and serine/threonine kinase